MNNFKAKVKHNGNHLHSGDWIFGSLVIKSKGTFIYVLEEDELGTLIREFEVEVFPETVCRFTSLFDKDKNPVFEHDLLEVPHNDFIKDGTHKVIWYGCGFCSRSIFFKDDIIANKNSLDWILNTGAKVTGSVFDLCEESPK